MPPPSCLPCWVQPASHSSPPPVPRTDEVPAGELSGQPRALLVGQNCQGAPRGPPRWDPCLSGSVPSSPPSSDEETPLPASQATELSPFRPSGDPPSPAATQQRLHDSCNPLSGRWGPHSHRPASGAQGGGSHDAREDRGLPLAGSSAIPWHLKRRTEFLGLMLARGACGVRVLRSGGGGGSRMGRVFAKCFLSRVCCMPEATALMLRGPPGNRRGCP